MEILLIYMVVDNCRIIAESTHCPTGLLGEGWVLHEQPMSKAFPKT